MSTNSEGPNIISQFHQKIRNYKETETVYFLFSHFHIVKPYSMSRSMFTWVNIDLEYG